jgi:hypothetical protein
MILYHFFALVLYNTIVLDSSFLVVDVAAQYVSEVELTEQIIDHVWDDYLYLATQKSLFKIARSGPMLIDKTLLPMRFNYLMLKGNDIILVATNEVIVLDRNNLAFKSGVGLEHGDHKPIVKDQSFATTPANDYIYLVSDAGGQSIIRIIDLRSGRLVRKTKTDRIRSFHYDVRNRAFVALDVKNNILIFDTFMKRQRRIELQVAANAISTHADGFMVQADQGILLVDTNGNVIDFQPIPQAFTRSGLVGLSHTAIVGFDSTTLRPEGWLTNDQKIVQLHPLSGSHHNIGTDAQNNYYLVDHKPISVTPLRLYKAQLKWTTPPLAVSDSLWYLQLGAFSNPANALEEYNAFRQDGLPVFIDSTDLYRVKLGGFPDKHAGLDIADKLDLKGWFVYERKLSNKQRGIFPVGAERYLIKDGVVGKEEP